MQVSHVESLGRVAVEFGRYGDEDRIRRMVSRNCDVYIDLSPGSIVSAGDTTWNRGLETWPDGSRRHAIFLVKFAEPMGGFDEVYTESTKIVDGTEWRRGMFPHLAALSQPDISQELLSRRVRRIAVCDPNSLWKIGRGQFYVPYLECGNTRLGIRSKWVGEMWDLATCYIFYISQE